MTDQKISLSIEVDDNGSIKVQQFGDKTVRTTRDVTVKTDTLLKKIQTRMGSVTRAAGGILSKLVSMKTMAIGALAGWGVKALAGSFLQVGSGMDQLKLSLDTITKGEGEKWFKELNEWAMKMPVNTKTAIEAFTRMRAMGLQPTIDQMTVLVDTTSALGGGQDTLMGISRALGQIATKGRVSTEELLQLAERGVPVFEILREKLGLTNEEIGKIGTLGIESTKAIDAIMTGLEERFGGQSKKMQGMWAGLWESIKSYWAEFQRMIMDSGVMDYLEGKLSSVIAMVDQWYKDGTMLAFAQQIADGFTGMAESLLTFLSSAWKNITKWYQQASESIYWIIQDLRPLYTLLVGIGRLISTVTGAWKKFNTMPKTIPQIGAEMAAVEGGGTVPQYAQGTGPAGLPYTGLFYGHKGEIVKNPAESEAERSGAGGGSVNITIAPTFMSGDANAARSVAREIKRMMTGQDRRWGTT